MTSADNRKRDQQKNMFSLKKLLTKGVMNPYLLGLMFACCSSSGTEPVFQLSFDGTLQAPKASGNPNVVHGNRVVLYKNGISGKAVIAGLDNKAEKVYRYKYDAKNNLSVDCGTISMFVKPLDWNGNDQYFHLFFEATGADSHLIIYKYVNSSQLYFVIGKKDDASLTVANTDIKNWKPDAWHHIACCWDKKEMSLYLDGKLINRKKIRVPPQTDFKEFAIGGFSPEIWGKNPQGTTLIDELKIYKEKINPAEIKNIWAEAALCKNRPSFLLGRTESAPTLNGIITEGEYTFKGTGFFEIDRGPNSPGIYANEQSEYYLTYDKEKLYLGIVTPVINNELRSKVKTRDGDKIWNDDVIELFINPPGPAKDVYHFIFNSGGALYDEKNKDSGWNINGICYTNKVAKGLWSLEAAIPFKALGLNLPADGDIWKINICRSFAFRRYYTSSSPVKSSYHDVEHFTRLQFCSEAPSIKLNAVNGLLAGKIDVDLLIENRLPDKAQFKVQAALNLEGENIFNYDKCLVVKGKNKLSIPIAGGNDQTFAGAKGKRRRVNGKLVENYGEGILNLQINSSELGTIFAASYPFLIGEPIKYLYMYTDPKEVLNIGIRQLELTREGKPLFLRCRLFNPQKVMVFEKKYQSKKRQYEIKLNTSKLAPGDYYLEMALFDINGNKISDIIKDNYKKFDSVSPPWQNNKIGETTKVPAPWTPLRLENNTVIRCWGRKLYYDNTPFPEQLISQGQELLSSPMSLQIEEKDNKTPKIVELETTWKEKSDNRIRRRSRSRIGTVDIITDTIIEYDGFMWFEIELKPTKITQIEKIVIDIPLKQDNATLVNSADPYLKGTGTLSANWCKNLIRRPVFWIGNEAAGLQWFAENLKGWHIKNINRSVEVLSKQNVKIIRLNIVDYPLLLNKPRKIAFGMQVTPVKPKIHGWRNLRMGWFMRGKYNLDPWVQIFKLYNYPDPAQLRQNGISKMSKLQGMGIKVLPYTALQCTSPFSPEYKYYGESWRNTITGREPEGYDDLSITWQCGFICPNSSSYRDFYLWKLNKAVQKLNIQGLYIDWGQVKFCENSKHGCGWCDDKGYPHPTYNILGSRKLVKRIYNLIKQHDPSSIIIHHISGLISMPAHAFADLMLDGENLIQQVAQAGKKGYYDILPLDKFRAAYMSHNWGPIMAFLPEFENSARTYNPSMQKFWQRDESLQPRLYLAGLILLHDSQCWPIFGLEQIYAQLWKIQDEFGWDDTVEFFPYWNNRQYIEIKSPKSNNIVASIFKKNDNFIIIPFNNTDKKVVVAMRIDLKKLGFPPNKTLELKNKLTQEHFTVINGNVAIPMNERSFKLLSTK
ncbi:MAG: DUF6067 family protein [Victivallaceae bacterium]|nr:DUF6067 family protein [Victivallaceae bacterium]